MKWHYHFLWIFLFAEIFLLTSFSFAGVSPKTLSIEEIIETVTRAVVIIRTDRATGTGFFVTGDGKLLTNSHVIAGAKSIEVENAQGEKFSVKRVLIDNPKEDLALLLVDIPPEKEVHALPLIPSIPKKGTTVVTVGNPEEIPFSAFQGYIANFTNIPVLGDVIQLDMSAYPGLSGSPVVNLRGEAIGIITCKYKSWERMNFAIPAQKALKLDYNLALESGDRLAEKGSYDEAVEAYGIAIAGNPRSVRAFYGRANVYYAQQRYREALEDLDRALKVNPRLPQIHYARGLCFLGLGDCDSARKEYVALLSLDASLAKEFLKFVRTKCTI